MDRLRTHSNTRQDGEVAATDASDKKMADGEDSKADGEINNTLRKKSSALNFDCLPLLR